MKKDKATNPFPCCDEFLLEKTRGQCQFGDWEKLVHLDYEILQEHPDRADIALLAAIGQIQIGNKKKAIQLVSYAKEWGCSKGYILKMLVSSTYNTLGMILAIKEKKEESFQYFKESLKIGFPKCDIALFTQARANTQLAKLGLLSGTKGRLQQIKSTTPINTTVFYNRLASSNENAPFLLLDSKSIPRSGLHYLKNTLATLFCEWYNEVGCCGDKPCSITSYADYAIKNNKFHVRLIKSHDFILNDPVIECSQNLQQLVLIRDPIFVLTSWFMLEQLSVHQELLKKHNINTKKIYLHHEKQVLTTAYSIIDENFAIPSLEMLKSWLSAKTNYIASFVNKWVYPEINETSPHYHIVKYEDINQFLIRILNKHDFYLSDATKLKIDNFKKSTEISFQNRDNPFILPSQTVTNFVNKHSELFDSAAKKVISLDKSGCLGSNYSSEANK